MSFIFDASDHARLATLFGGTKGSIGTGPYAGYKPETREAPNGDTKACEACNGLTWAISYPHPDNVKCTTCHGTGRVPNVDAGKRYLHVALKYNPPAWALEYLARAHFEACRVATALGVPPEFRPHEADATLRVVEYPSAACEYEGVITGNGYWRCVVCGHRQMASPGGPSDRVCPALASGAGSAEHTDMDLFSILCWRSTPDDLEIGAVSGDVHARTFEGDRAACGCNWTRTPIYGDVLHRCDVHKRVDAARALSPGLHIGELGELVGLGPATPHRVPARPYAQKSIVYFAMPDHGAILRNTQSARKCFNCKGSSVVAGPHEYSSEACYCRGGFAPQTVGEWVAERIARSRVGGYR